MSENDADALFRRHGVADLKAILHKIKADADRKKHDLRIMVGERYRDVIGAADAIQLMREAAEQMRSLFDQTSGLCDVAGLKQQVHDLTTANRDLAEEDRKQQLFHVAAQIRLLVITPEQIWSALERHQHLAASRLYLIARLVFRELQTGKQAVLIKTSFPVVQRQWDAISSFRVQIVEKATASLRATDMDEKSLCDTLGAIALLDNLPPKAILDVLLAQRAHAIGEIFDGLPLPPDQSAAADTIADKIAQSISVIQKTLATVESLFVTTAQGSASASAPASAPKSRIVAFLRSLQLDPSVTATSTASMPKVSFAPSAEPAAATPDARSASHDAERLVSSLYSEKANIYIIFRHLPESIRHFSPVINFGTGLSELTNAGVQTASKAWIAGVIALLNKHVGAALVAITSGAVLAGIRAAVVTGISSVEFKTEHNKDAAALLPPTTGASGLSVSTTPSSQQPSSRQWSGMVSQLLSDASFSLWTSIYQPLFLSRAKDLIASAFDAIAHQPRSLLPSALEMLNQGLHADRDVARFVWDSAAPDQPDRTISHETLQAVCRMQTPAMTSLGAAFESAALAVRDDLFPLLGSVVVSNRPAASHAGQRSAVSAAPATRIQEPRYGSFDLSADSHTLVGVLHDSFLKAAEAYSDGMSLFLDEIRGRLSEAQMESYVLGIDQSLFIGRSARIIALKFGKLHALFDVRLEGTAAVTAGTPASAGGRGTAGREERLLLPVQERLMDVYTQAHSLWTSSVGKHLEAGLLQKLEREDWRHAERFQTLWEGMTIQAQGDAGDVMESKISLPVHASSFVLIVLFDVCAELNRIGSYTLEKPCLKMLLLELATRIISVYTTFVNAHIATETVSEKGAFQLLFDFKWLMKVMEGSWGISAGSPASAIPDTRTEQDAASVIASIRGKIDPIDLAIVDANIASNVDRFYYRTSVLLGPLLLLNPKSQDTKRNPSLQEQHNLVSLAPPSPRFALLPLSGAPHGSKPFAPRKSILSEPRSSGPASTTGSAPSVPAKQPRTRSKPSSAVRLSKNGAASGSRTPPQLFSIAERLPSLGTAIGQAFAGPSAAAGGGSGGSSGQGTNSGRVMGLVNAVAGGFSQHFISGVWGAAASPTASTTSPFSSVPAASGSTLPSSSAPKKWGTR
ncbi:hypothetical protein BC831DRAFT_512430 [Entophlyctis helioformis]|nr:hypothetical protein BC831DRAFT_512430 [Entophlyctis helioformis]